MKFLNKHIVLKKSKYLVTILIFAATLFCSGCKKFVEVDPPISELVTTSVFNNNATAIAAQTAIYVQMSGPESYNIAQNTGLLGDELINYSNTLSQRQLYTNAMSATPNVTGPWGTAYSYIYQANAIIEGLGNNTGVSDSIKQQLIGESKFIRAFWHFYLTNIYGDVPLVISTDYTVNSKIRRSAREVVYDQIITDLKDAQDLLSSNYLDGSNNTGTSERVRPTKWAAAALLARVYLYHKDFSAAEKQASLVINNSGTYNLLSDLNQVFLANSSEAIWQLQTPQPINNTATLDGTSFILITSPANAGQNSGTSISPQLLNSFEDGDHRKSEWIGSFSSGSSTWYFPYKYKLRQSTEITEYVMVLRLAEQYLIRAEALAQQNKLSDAINDVNLLRLKHGGLTKSLPTPTSLEDCLSLILHERQVELFTEWGNRWFDLIRTGNANKVMGGPNGICHLKGGVWNPNGEQQLYPIPQYDISKNPNLTQNLGY